MKAPTSVTVFITGPILAFAVSGHPGFLDMKMAGVILMATGVLGLWPLGGKFWVLLGRARLRQMLDESAPLQGVRVPLDELLSREPDVCAPCTGHQEPRRGPAKPAGGDQE